MKINGKEYGLEFNVQAHEEVAKLCPGQDIARMEELYNHGSNRSLQADIAIAIALNRGYEDHRHFEDPDYVQDYLTEEDFRFLPFYMITEVEKEITRVMAEGSGQTVEAEPVKSSTKNGKGAKE